MKNIKRILFIISVAVVIFACNNPSDKSAANTASATTAITDRSSDASAMVIPAFSNQELTEFCTSYKLHITQLISVIRNNDNAGLKQAYENYAANFDQLSKMITKAKLNGPEELKKLNLFLRQTGPFVNQITQSPNIQKLSDEHFAEHEKNMQANQ